MKSSVVLWVGACLVVCSAVDRSNFKTCEQSGFCKRNRALQAGVERYVVLPETIKKLSSGVEFVLLDLQTSVRLNGTISVATVGNIRIQIREREPIRKRYDIPIGDVLKSELRGERVGMFKGKEKLTLSWMEHSVVMTYKPFKIDAKMSNIPLISVNAKQLMNYEHFRTKENEESPVKKEEETDKRDTGDKNEQNEDEFGKWEEKFKEYPDTKPFGPSSVGMDFSFPGAQQVYGIPEHADSLALKTTKDGDPYRLYNLDVFEYELWNPMALYGSVPLMYAHSKLSTVGLFWYNPSETWVDIASNNADKGLFRSVMGVFGGVDQIPQVDTHWFSESGDIDVFLLMGFRPLDVARQYSELTGVTSLPPLFSLAYHQSRWNYNDEQDVLTVDENFDKHDIPMDVMWLDIEHTDGKRYLTWDKEKFPDPKRMIDKLAAKSRKMVTIVDPHIKDDDNYFLFAEGKAKGYFVKDKDNNDYNGFCWPGSSRWFDYLRPEVRDYWADQFSVDKYWGSSTDLFAWNDMNEPSVFNGPEISMHKDALHAGGVEHREVHNLYGLYQQRATAEGQMQRSDDELRPFVLSRAFFAGSQRWGAIWTGDNTGTWEHLRVTVPMLLSLSISGITFCGADVGGFFKNPDSELLTRWYQAGAYQPFFRAHAHIDSKRREPWLLEARYTKSIRSAIRQRYELLPFWYTEFYLGESSGFPIMRPLWFNYPTEEKTYRIDNQYLLAHSLLVRPVTEQAAASVSVFLPGEYDFWYDIQNYKKYQGNQEITVDVDLESVPVFQRGGAIVPRKQRVRRASYLMRDDPLTLIVCLDPHGQASGDFYIDDYESFDYKHKKAFMHREFQFVHNQLRNSERHKSDFTTKTWLEKVIVAGLSFEPKSATLFTLDGTETSLRFTYKENVMMIRKPGANLDVYWHIQIE